MGRSLLILAALAAAVVLVRPRGQRQADGLRGWAWLALGLALQVLWVRVLSLHAACASAAWMYWGNVTGRRLTAV